MILDVSSIKVRRLVKHNLPDGKPCCESLGVFVAFQVFHIILFQCSLENFKAHRGKTYRPVTAHTSFPNMYLNIRIFLDNVILKDCSDTYECIFIYIF